MKNILSVNNLTIQILGSQGFQPLVSNINLTLRELEVVALVGGSGGGKTSIGFSLLQLLPMAMKITQGEILFEGRNLLDLTNKQMQSVRGGKIGMVFQEPLSAFNPVFKVGNQIAEVLKYHTNLSAGKIKNKVHELLDVVEVPDPKRVAQYYPHQLSGGLRQRAMIAQAIAASPKVIIADEPTSNLDVTIQAKILELFKKLKKELNVSLLLITHDLGVVRFLADRVFVLHGGRIVEEGKAEEIFNNPKDEFTKTLIKVIED
ncbi:MAG: ABC transporter ATP-binding protein [Candidatus Aceula meridiana]|nr:ABC transporter ATP-binding protein [Candidatus Aceula meridiana]